MADFAARNEMTRPTLVLLAGPPGAGKTTIALEVGRVMGWPVVDKDTLKSVLLTEGGAEEIAGRASYELMFALGRDLLVQQRLSVILDSPAAYPVVVERTSELVRAAGGRLAVVLCLADREVRNRRLATRSARRSQWRMDTSDMGSRERWDAYLPAGTLTVVTTRPVADLVPEIVAYLRRDEDGGVGQG